MFALLFSAILFLLLSLSIPQKQRFQKENSKKRDREDRIRGSTNVDAPTFVKVPFSHVLDPSSVF
jgi:hypothetical protein